MSTSNAVPIQCTSHVAKGCLAWFRPTARGPRTTVCPVCRVQINRDKTAARKRCVKLNSSATESLSSNQDPIAQALRITQDAVPAPPEKRVHKVQKNSSKGTPVPDEDSDFEKVVCGNASKPTPLSSTPLSGAPDDSLHKTQNGTPQEPIAQNAKKSIDELVEEHIAWLRQPWSAKG